MRAMVLWRSDRLDDAELGYRDAVEQLERALQDHPTHRGLRFRLGEAYNLLAVVLGQLGRDKDSQTAFERSVDVFRELVAAHPGVRNYHGQLAGTLANLGIVHSKRDEHDRSLPLFGEALDEVRRALQIDANASDYLGYRRMIGKEIATAHLLQGRHREGETAVRELLQEVPNGSQWTAGRLLAACGKACANDDSLPAEARAQQVARYGDAAIPLLQAAVDAGEVQPQALDSTVFDLLRARDDFQAMVLKLRR
jgi:tetratricopeptide (TPR) repeat protein